MRQALDLPQIVTRALSQLDAYGLASLTMRSLADDLGIRPSALYWHVENKQTLLAAVADRIVSSAEPVAGVDATARALRAALLAHRDGAEVVLSSAALGLGGLGVADRFRDAIGPHAPETAANVLAQFVLGHASLVQQRLQAAVLGAYDGDAEASSRAFADEFDAGIAALIRGLSG